MLKSHGDGDLFYPQHMLWLRNKQNMEKSLEKSGALLNIYLKLQRLLVH